MLFVFVIAAALWIFGGFAGMPRSLRFWLLGLLYVAVLGVQLAFPPGNVLKEATGGTVGFWLLLGGFAVLVVLYRAVLKALLKHANKHDVAVPDQQGGSFSDTELDRYARHIILREVGGAGQKALKDASVLVIGAGGLGTPVLQYLAAAGVGTIGMIDDDAVDNSNLHRQVIHRDWNIGMPKVFSAEAAINAQNPFVTVKPYNRRLTEDLAPELVAEYDLVLDGCDNFETRYLINRVCVAAGVPLISGALSQWEGQLSVFDPANGAPCYQCIFPQAPAPHLAPSCAEAGVIGPLPGVIGSMMAVEAVKVLTGAGTTLRGQMVIYDALYGENRTIRVSPRADCLVCGGPKGPE